jgi:hypothetical protein
MLVLCKEIHQPALLGQFLSRFVLKAAASLKLTERETSAIRNRPIKRENENKLEEMRYVQ